MHVWLNKLEGRVEVKGSSAVFTPAASDDGDATIRFDLTRVGQLLRSRKDETTLKFTVDTHTYLIRFDSGGEREQFVDLLVRTKSDAAAASSPTATTTITTSTNDNHSSGSSIGNKVSTTDQWVTSSICSAAVDHGILDEEELRALLDSEEQRGVVHVFDALEALVDRDTLRLLPVTEQLENDILHQIPILAAIYADRVVDLDTRQSFWEAVVRKYFCFSRTFLEDDMRHMEGESGDGNNEAHAPLAAADSATATLHRTRHHTVPAHDGLREINHASEEALPSQVACKMSASASRAADGVREESADYDDDDEERHLMDRILGHRRRQPRRHAGLFAASRASSCRRGGEGNNTKRRRMGDASERQSAEENASSAQDRTTPAVYYVAACVQRSAAEEKKETEKGAPSAPDGGGDAAHEDDDDSMPHMMVHTDEFRGVRVQRNAPRESTSRQVLELLRKFWRSTSAGARRGMRDKLRSYARDGQTNISFAIRHCLRRACEIAEDVPK